MNLLPQIINLLKYALVGLMISPISKAQGDCTIASLHGVYELHGEFDSFRIWRLEFARGELISSSNEDLSADEWPVDILPDVWDSTRFRVVQSTYGSEAIIETTAHLWIPGCNDNRARLVAVAGWSAFFDQSGGGSHAMTPHVFTVKAVE